MDGWTFLQQQRQDPALAGIPVVIVSADSSQKAQSIALGAAAHLQKPIEPDELTTRVEDYIPLPP